MQLCDIVEPAVVERKRPDTGVFAVLPGRIAEREPERSVVLLEEPRLRPNYGCDFVRPLLFEFAELESSEPFFGVPALTEPTLRWLAFPDALVPADLPADFEFQVDLHCGSDDSSSANSNSNGLTKSQP